MEMDRWVDLVDYNNNCCYWQEEEDLWLQHHNTHDPYKAECTLVPVVAAAAVVDGKLDGWQKERKGGY